MRFDTYQEAKEEALVQIKKINEWLLSNWWDGLPVVICDKDVWEKHRGTKVITRDGTHVVKLINNGLKTKFNIDVSNTRHQEQEYYKVGFITYPYLNDTISLSEHYKVKISSQNQPGNIETFYCDLYNEKNELANRFLVLRKSDNSFVDVYSKPESLKNKRKEVVEIIKQKYRELLKAV